CVHFYDLVRYFLELGWPRRISASGGVYMRRNTPDLTLPDTQIACFDYDDLQVVWNQRNWGANPDPDYPWGATLYGEKGTLKLSVHRYDFIPNGQGERQSGSFVDQRDAYPQDVEHQETELFAAPATRAHMRDFLAARHEGRRPVSDIEEGHISTACCLLANVSMKVGRSLVWDVENQRIAGDDEANALLARSYRAPWERP
ncbi:MAG: gfo/Idh/MocA family oxidoreductase, partial [Planctomycetales bacterium]|nr:gfo/Idh/MocA family oxidoreductase [Planctomycetales bacterium]